MDTSYLIKRELAPKIHALAEKFPVVTLTGPRQSGKSTLLRTQFPDYTYLSLEDPDIREFALSDPRGFLRQYPNKAIFDEIQKVPDLFSYIQSHVDNSRETGVYLLAGSQNFILMKNITQTLAGRTALLKLLPFSCQELHQVNKLPDTPDEQIFKGFYPRLYDRDINPSDYYPNYIQTYVERDVRNLLKISDLNKFIKFLRLCAGRIGQILNMTSLATETGITSTTVDGWISVLEASYVCYRLEPNFNNFNKRVIKSPKLYFYDTGLACSLLGLASADQVSTFYMRGALFENLVINQFLKNAYNKGTNPDLSFWRDSQGNEIDLIVTSGNQMTGYEIKSGATMNTDYFNGLDKWGRLSSTPPERLNVIYGGEQALQTSRGNIIPFKELY